MCPHCKICKLLDSFNNHTKSKDGKQHYCKKCESEYKKAYDGLKRQKKHELQLSKREDLENEVWLPVIGYEGFYEVSDLGRIYSIRYGVIMFQSTKKVGKEYRSKTVKLQNGIVIKGFGVHRIVAFAHIPNPDNLPEIDHMDNDATNNNKTNLQWCTRGDQIRWAYERGRDRKFGDKASSAKLTNSQVVELRHKYKNGIRFTDLIKLYGVSRSALCEILKNKTYKTA